MVKDETSIKEMVKELNNLNESKEFKEWMELLYKGKKDKPPYVRVTKENLINKYCWDLAFYLHIKYDVELKTMSYIGDKTKDVIVGHCFVRAKNELYYDGWNTDGVKTPEELQWYIDTLRSSNIYPHGHIEIFDKGDCTTHPDYIPYKPKLLKILKQKNNKSI